MPHSCRPSGTWIQLPQAVKLLKVGNCNICSKKKNTSNRNFKKKKILSSRSSNSKIFHRVLTDSIPGWAYMQKKFTTRPYVFTLSWGYCFWPKGWVSAGASFKNAALLLLTVSHYWSVKPLMMFKNQRWDRKCRKGWSSTWLYFLKLVLQIRTPEHSGFLGGWNL